MLLNKKTHRTTIIAEIGVNHNGNFKTAKRLIKVAKDIGADYAKFQMYEPDEMVTETAKKAKYQNKSMGKSISQKDMLRKYYFSETEIKKLYNYCKKVGIKFLSSIFDEQSLERYVKLKPDYIKLPSPEINNIFLLRKIKKIKNKIPIIFSTGMSSEKDILEVYKILGKNFSLIPMYCVSSYPALLSEIDLKKFINMKKKYKIIGLSDHTNSLETSIICTYLKVNIIERHLTLDNKQIGPDHSSSLNPHDFKEFIMSVRNTEVLISKNVKNKNEIKNRKFVRKILVARNAIKKGEKFTVRNVTCKRSGIRGYDPMFFKKIENKKSIKSYLKDEIIYL